MTLLRKVYIRLKKFLYRKNFLYLSIHAAVGKDGCGKGCKIVGAEKIKIDDEAYIEEGTEIIALNNHASMRINAEIVIGKNTRIHSRTRITAAGSVSIENNVLIAPEVFITDHNHGMNPEIEEGYAKQDLVVKPVRIGDGTWIGQRACILPGVTIGKHCIIGAGSVCTHSIPDYSMAVGVPARVIKQWNTKSKQWVSINEKHPRKGNQFR